MDARTGVIRVSGPAQADRRPWPMRSPSYLKQAGLTKRVQQAGIIEEWAELVGPQIAAVTAPESVTPDGVLRVTGRHGGLGH